MYDNIKHRIPWYCIPIIVFAVHSIYHSYCHTMNILEYRPWDMHFATIVKLTTLHLIICPLFIFALCFFRLFYALGNEYTTIEDNEILLWSFLIVASMIVESFL